MKEVEQQLRAEVERLRSEVESYKQLELGRLQTQLQSVWQEKEDWKAEAKRLGQANIAYKDEVREQMEMLKAKLEAAKALQNGNSRVVHGLGTNRNG
jgi:cytochrome c556